MPILLDSIAEAGPEHAGAVIVTGSHGGASATAYALAVRPFAVVFNDAGVGKDGAGIAALGLLQAIGVAAVAVRHDSARIGEAEETLRCGVVSHINATASAHGVRQGMAAAAATELLEAALRRRHTGKLAQSTSN